MKEKRDWKDRGCSLEYLRPCLHQPFEVVSFPFGSAGPHTTRPLLVTLRKAKKDIRRAVQNGSCPSTEVKPRGSAEAEWPRVELAGAAISFAGQFGQLPPLSPGLAPPAALPGSPFGLSALLTPGWNKDRGKFPVVCAFQQRLLLSAPDRHARSEAPGAPGCQRQLRKEPQA